nr:unnamed protein product [Callosobruchus analis]
MSMVHEPLRYAHDEGHTDVCFAEDGSKYITCGADGDIRIWSSDDNEDPVHNCVGELAWAVGQKGEHLYVATGSNDIQILKIADGERDGVLGRYVAPINHIAAAKNSQLVALAGEDMEVKLIDIASTPRDVTIFDGLDGPCLSVAICPKSKFLAASSGDTKLRVWAIETKTIVKEISCFPKVNSFENAKLLCRIDFEPSDGRMLAYPVKNTVVVLNIESWSEVTKLTSAEIDASYSIVKYSPCGRYIMATTVNGDFAVWDCITENVVNISKHEKNVAVCGLAWNPKGNGEVIYTDVEGELGKITGVVVSNKTKNVQNNEEPAGSELGDDNDFVEGAAMDDDDDEDNENAISVEKLKRDIMGSPEPELEALTDDASICSKSPRPRTPETPLQSPFMPSSTPDHLDARYMCWNDIGIIRCYGNNAYEGDTKSIEVEFIDSTFHSSMMIRNYVDYTMGSISKGALAVANSSQLYVIPLASATKEWILKVEEPEEIILVASSENLVCFAMNNYMVRVCSIYGTQRAVVSVPGPPITMTAARNYLLVAYHAAPPRNGDQCINVRLFRFQGMSIDSKDISSALGPESTLSWLGFSDVGTPAILDSSGMLYMYPLVANTWIPFCDTSKHMKSPSDKFFVTTVFETYQAVGGIKCKGCAYPTLIPRPTLCELPLEPPFAESSTEKTQMEMNLFTWSTLQVADVDKKAKETALKTFALACRNNLDERAFELMEIISNPQVVTLGLKYASKLEKRRLVEKLMDLATRIADEGEDLGVARLAETPDSNSIKPPRKLSLSTNKSTPKNRAEKNSVIPEMPSSISKYAGVLDGSVNDSQNLNGSREAESQDSQNSEVTPKETKKSNFLKSLKKAQNKTPNPLSLTDKYAGVSFENNDKNGKAGNGETSEKRKLSDSETDKQKEKQRKLDSFKFSKRT